ncbi:MAG: GNAT family N-acetyltransferase [Bacteroidetes bacterium]|nr:GNAT family N-acetyltransferase [Bacteroidota bacterium]
MFIKGENIYLRALEPSDVDVLYKWENNREIWHVSNTQTPFSRYVLEQFLVNAHEDIYTNKQLRLIISQHGNDAAVGAIDLFDFDPYHLRAGIGILISEEYRNKGYAYEALKLLKDYAFNTLLVKQLYANVTVNAPASLQLFEKSGFEKIGLKKQWNRSSANEFSDEWLLQLINQ